jgi:hypothetical protein
MAAFAKRLVTGHDFSRAEKLARSKAERVQKPCAVPTALAILKS